MNILCLKNMFEFLTYLHRLKISIMYSNTVVWYIQPLKSISVFSLKIFSRLLTFTSGSNSAQTHPFISSFDYQTVQTSLYVVVKLFINFIKFQHDSTWQRRLADKKRRLKCIVLLYIKQITNIIKYQLYMNTSKNNR